jgi:hypothetical protein
MCGAVILSTATVVSGQKNTQVYIIKDVQQEVQ